MATSNSNPVPSSNPLLFHPPDALSQYARTVFLSSDDAGKKPLPRRTDYIGPVSWLQAVQACVGTDIIFALDEALMCQGRFVGRYNEDRIWAYGPDSLAQYSGIVLLGNTVGPNRVEHRWGLSYTDFPRTLLDALVFEPILDMQGITEALSDFYYTHGGQIAELTVPAQYQTAFQALLQDAVSYYTA